jgi:uncharacterized repeat protein (TIGR01451 family)
MRSRLLALIAAACLAGGLVGVTAGVALAAPVCGAHCYTNGATGSDVTGDGTAGNPYATINKSLTDVTPGGIVTVANTATYPEFVDITKAVTLEGANSGVACRGTRGTETVVTGTTFGAFRISANDVTINGFQISDPLDAANLNAGIWTSNTVKGYHITNNLLSNNPEGVYANSNGAALIDCNIFDSNNVAGGGSPGVGIYGDQGDIDLTIDDNELTNHNINNPINLVTPNIPLIHKNLTITDNWIHNNPNAAQIYLLAVDGATITGNTINPGGSVSNIRLGGGNKDFDINHNILNGGSRGVAVEDDNIANGTTLGLNSNIVVMRNSLTNHDTSGIDNPGGQTLPVNGTCNWWGSAAGPGPGGPPRDDVGANVTFVPYLVTSNLDGSCGPDLTIAKTHTDPFRQGDIGDTYTITVTNNGGGPTAGTVTVVDTPPPFFSPTAISGTGWTCTLATRTCTRADALAPGASYPPITLTGNVGTGPAAGSNTATVSGGGDVNVFNNVATDATTVSGIADMTVTKSHTGSGRVWSLVRFTITVSNNGNGPTVGPVHVQDTLPFGLFPISMSGPGWICIPFTGHCVRGSVLPAGSSYPPITVRAFITWGSPSLVVNTVTVSGGGETNTGNDTATDGLTVYHWITF